MADLFISYKSEDRPWAERLYLELKRKYPAIDIFWDRESIPLGQDFRKVLDDAIDSARHFAVLWSERAKASNEIGPEIEGFRQNVKNQPLAAGAPRTLFYIPLEGSYGPLEAPQGLADLRQRAVYDVNAADLGLAKLDADPVRAEWNRIIRKTGDVVSYVSTTSAVTLAILAMDQTMLGTLDHVLDYSISRSAPTLNDFLKGLGLTLAQAKDRYERNAFEWEPLGTTETIVDFMQELRIEANRNLKKEFQFHWAPQDLMEVARHASSMQDLQNQINALSNGPSVVVVDPISLYHPGVKEIFDRLVEYSNKPNSVIIAVSPIEPPGLDSLYRSLRSKGAPVLDRYFLPLMPAQGLFAHCGVNLRYSPEFERLIRCSLGMYHLQRKTSEEKPLVSMGG